MKPMFTKEEVCVAVGVSLQTINNWYRFKKENPDDMYAKMLPDPIILKTRRQKVWTHNDIETLKRFKEMKPKGRNGVMGSVTQRYQKNVESQKT